MSHQLVATNKEETEVSEDLSVPCDGEIRTFEFTPAKALRQGRANFRLELSDGKIRNFRANEKVCQQMRDAVLTYYSEEIIDLLTKKGLIPS